MVPEEDESYMEKCRLLIQMAIDDNYRRKDMLEAIHNKAGIISGFSLTVITLIGAIIVEGDFTLSNCAIFNLVILLISLIISISVGAYILYPKEFITYALFENNRIEELIKVQISEEKLIGDVLSNFREMHKKNSERHKKEATLCKVSLISFIIGMVYVILFFISIVLGG